MENFARDNPGRPASEPRFTLWEISKLELHAAKETDPALKAKYEKHYCDALENEREDRSRRILIEKDADELLDPVGAVAGQPRNTALQDLTHHHSHQHEMSFER